MFTTEKRITYSGDWNFSAPVTYAQPDYNALKRRWFYVLDEYRNRRFEAIDRCQNVIQQDRQVAFRILRTRSKTTEEVLVEMERCNLRPALYEELIGFVGAYRYSELYISIVALGSATADDERLAPCVLYDDDSNQCFDMCWTNRGWSAPHVFLAVPIDA